MMNDFYCHIDSTKDKATSRQDEDSHYKPNEGKFEYTFEDFSTFNK